MTDQEHNEFYKWAEQQTVPVGFDRVEAILNSLNNAGDAEDQLQCAKSTFHMYVDQGVSFLN
jgi:hypothetical protein